MDMNKILVVGSLNMDFLIEADRLPCEGETVLGTGCSWKPGGKGANQAFTAGRLGGSVSMIGAVGADVYGQALNDSLRLAGVDVSGVEKLEEYPTGMAFVMLDKSGQNRIIVIPGANFALTEQMVERHLSLMDRCDVVVMQMEIPLNVLIYTAREAKKRGKTVILDPAPAPAAIPKQLLSCVDLIKPNETEFNRLCSAKAKTMEEIQKAARVLFDGGVKAVVTTRGSKGAVVVTKNALDHIPAEAVRAVDTTAAGDGFTAALALRLREGNLKAAVMFANRVAGKVVQKKGAQSSIPTMEEVLGDG